jgi:Na+/H+ antiporter NhaD/arsenite permease-like protein
MIMKKILFFTLLLFVLSSYVGNDLYAYQNETHVQNVTQTSETTVESSIPPVFMIAPFVLLLAMIATGPLFYAHFWEKHYYKVAIALGLFVVVYYWFVMKDTEHLVHTLGEYLSFIALLGSLFVASGGILIRVNKKATPLLNVVILFIGAIIANIIGTTGASMLLIRPFMKLNKGRLKPYHVIFFIFLVSNIGGVLTPIGDPPLFLGYLRGINFFWFLQHGWYIWLPTVLIILIIFYLIDFRNKETIEKDNYSGKIEFKGIKNLGFLLIVLISVFLDPSVFSWVPNLSPLPFGIREIIMFSVMFAAYKFADEDILLANEFTFAPIKEVAFLFVGIFATMIPALQLIANEARQLKDGVTPGLLYWTSGGLSSILDNAPTFLNFLSAEMGRFALDVNSKTDVYNLVNAHPVYLQAISVACVFFGANTYIGNGPNFMVKSIAESSGIKMPSFFGYIVKYSLPVLIPIFFVIWLIFFRG